MFPRHILRQHLLRRLWLVLIAALPLLAAFEAVSLAQSAGQSAGQSATQTAQAKVHALRVGDHGTTTRFVAELTSPVAYRIFVLADPDRVVLDLPPLDWRALPAGTGRGSGLIQAWQREDFRDTRSRLVLRVKAPTVVASTFVLPPQGGHLYRLVVDLMPAGRPASSQPLAPPLTAPQNAGSQNAAAQAGTAEDATARATAQRAMAALMGAPPGPLDAPAPPSAVSPLPVPRPAPARRAWIVILDPGHGGPDPGAVGQNGALEKRIVLEVARRLKERLDASGRYRVLMTRNSDIYLPLRERVAFARAANADLFVSLHADWIDRAQVRGASVYTLSEDASDKEAQELAARENRADIIAGVDLSAESNEVTTILIDLAQRETLNHAIRFARVLVPELSSAGQLLDRTHRFAGFRVLKAPDVPSVLVELGYLSNREDERMLASAAGQARLADALARAVDAYFAAGQS